MEQKRTIGILLKELYQRAGCSTLHLCTVCCTNAPHTAMQSNMYAMYIEAGCKHDALWIRYRKMARFESWSNGFVICERCNSIAWML